MTEKTTGVAWIYVKVEIDVWQRIVKRYPINQLGRHIADSLKEMDRDLQERDHPEMKGVALECKGCGYSWNYKGKAYRIKCHKCGYHIRTGISKKGGEVQHSSKP